MALADHAVTELPQPDVFGGCGDVDRLLVKLRKIHGEGARPDIAPEVARACGGGGSAAAGGGFAGVGMSGVRGVHSYARTGTAGRFMVKVALELEHDVAVRLRREAASRDVPLDYLVRNLLDVVARDRLVDAVLDDGDLPSP